MPASPRARSSNGNGRSTLATTLDAQNPTLLRAGRFDAAFVIGVLLPLVVIFLGYDLFASEREAQTWPLVASCGVPLRTLLAGKVVARIGLVAAAAVAALVMAAVLAAGPVQPPDWWVRLAGAVLVVVLYIGVWTLVAAAVNTRGGASAANAIVLTAA